MIGVLLINLGTPDAPSTPAVRRYLRQFLSDPRVIDINPIARSLLVNLLIAPFRSPKSAEAYRKIWTEEGSPLLVNTNRLAQAISEKLGKEFAVEVGMRYGNPSIASAMQRLTDRGVKRIRVLPLFPQYASSSSGSALEEVFRVAGSLWNVPDIESMPPFFEHPGFIKSFAAVGQPVLEKTRPNQVIFSFHGLPERQIRKSDATGRHCLTFDDCCEQVIPSETYCYRAQCFRTAQLIAKELKIPPEFCSVSFQSRLGRTPWIKPYTDHLIPQIIRAGRKRIVVFCPSFVADCLETLEEIEIRGRDMALAAGADVLELVPSLNDHPSWVETVAAMVKG